MALSPVKAYYQAAKQIETDYDDLTDFANNGGKMPDTQTLYDRVFTPSLKLETLYAAAAQAIDDRGWLELSQYHFRLCGKLNLNPPAPIARHPQKTPLSSGASKKHSSNHPSKPSSKSGSSEKAYSSQSQQAFSRQKASSTSHAQKTSSASTSRAPSKPSNSDGLYATQLMTMVENDNPLQDIAKTYIYMTATSQFRGYKLLCKINGGVVEDVEKEGMVHLIKNPKSLLNRVSYHGQTMSIIDHLIVKAGGKPFCVDVEPYTPESWEKTVNVCTETQIKERLDICLTKNWYVNRQETLPTKTEWENSQAEQRKLNQEIFCLVKDKTGIATPMEFIGALQGRGGYEARKIGETALQFDPKEGQFYKLDKYVAKEGKPPLKEPTEEYEIVDESHNFCEAIKRTGNHLYLYLDGKTNSCILINGKMYPAIGPDRRGGSKDPSYCFRQGDVICDNSGTYLFTVGKNGAILYPGNEKHDYKSEPDGVNQSLSFARDFAKSHPSNSPYYQYTVRPRAAEISERLCPGFSFYNSVSSDETVALEEAAFENYGKKGDLIYIDVPNDPVLKSLIAYLEKEFEVMQYTDAQKMTRIALLSTYLLCNEVDNPKLQDNNYHNYLLGELVRAGAEKVKYRAALNKVLCDALKIPCALIFGVIDVKKPIYFNQTIVGSTKSPAVHAWTVMQADGRKYLVDSAKGCIFPLDNLPGTTPEAKKELKDYYGAKG